MNVKNSALRALQGASTALLEVPGVPALDALELANLIEGTEAPLRAFDRARRSQVDAAILRDANGEKVKTKEGDDYRIDPEKYEALQESLLELGAKQAELPDVRIPFEMVKRVIEANPKDTKGVGRSWIIAALRPALEVNADAG